MHGLSGGLQYNIFEILILIILILVAILIVQTLMRNYKGISKAGGFDDDEEYAGGATSVKYKKLKMEDKDAYIRKLFLSKKEGGLGYYKEEDLSKPFISIKIKPMHE